MGRYNKRLQVAKKLKNEKNLSSTAVAKTFENKDKQFVQFSTIDLIKNSNAEVNLLLEKPSKKSLVNKVQASKVNCKVTKKDKMKMRKDNLKQRLEAMEIIKSEEIAAKKRKNKAITGDLKPISATLDDILAQDEKKQCKNVKEKLKESRPTKQNKVKQQMLNDIAIFQQVIKHPQYSKDPFSTISTHIENKMLLEAIDSQ